MLLSARHDDSQKFDAFTIHARLADRATNARFRCGSIFIEIEDQVKRQRCVALAWNLDLSRRIACERDLPDTFESLAGIAKLQRATQGTQRGGGEG